MALFIALLAYGLITNSPDTGIDDRLAKGQTAEAPQFELPVLARGDLGTRLEAELRPALADGRVSLRELKDRRIVLNFWASWCVPCQKEAPVLERTWLQARRQGVVFLGLNMQDVTDDARRFISRYRNTYLNVRDGSDAVARDWGLTGIPETFFIAPRNRVVGHVIGVVSDDQMRTGLSATATGQPVGSAQGGERSGTR